MKKSTLIFIFAIVLFSMSVSAAYTGYQTFTADISSFVAKSYKCTDATCTAVNLYETEGPSSTNVLNYAGSAGSANHDWYVLYFYDDNNCHVPYTWWTEIWGPGNFNMGTTNIDFYKQDKDHCGANVKNMDQTAAVVLPGQSVTVTADIQSAWIINGNLPKFIPPELDQYYNSKVDVYFTVFNNDYSQTLYEEHDFVLINWNEWYYPSYDWTPTQPGTYHLRIWTKMDNDCRCEGSNLKWMEVTITVPAPYCGDSICNDGSSKTCEPNGATRDDICTNNVDTGNLANGICRTTGNDACTYCGDGVKQSSEQCDDGNFVNGDGCSSICQFEPYCGDSICNDGNSKTCEPNGNTRDDICTNNVDTGNLANGICRTEGTYACTYCGDGVLHEGAGEQCDDGNFNNGDGCSSTCHIEEGCLDGHKKDNYGNLLEGWEISVKEKGQPDSSKVVTETNENGYYYFRALTPGKTYVVTETMKEGWEVASGYSISYEVQVSPGQVCTEQDFVNELIPYCGDGNLDEGEYCDDGNTNNNDACRNDCTLPYCGDHIIDSDEECDDGNTNNNDACRNDCTLPYCGDGILDSNEQCDDGNNNNEDGCSNTCDIEYGCITGAKRDQDMVGLEGWTIHLKKVGQSDSSSITVVTDHTGYFEFENLEFGNYVIWEEMQEGWVAITDDRLEIEVDATVCEHVLFKNKLSPYCGDEEINQETEECDDGNTNNNDACRNDCTLPYCGDHITDSNEECDDGNTNNNDACSNLCKTNYCGDNVINNGEQCDDGNNNNFDECSNSCVLNYCGDHVINNDEECDDGNENNNDACSNECELNYCGDHVVNNDEQCDDGNNNNNDSCRNDCTFPVCGDGYLNPGEECDDGNNDNEDTCTNECTVPVCGDGYLNPWEQCDDGNNLNNDGCNSQCVIEYCGDNVKQDNEECDDGNNNNEDGCSNTCDIEYGCITGAKRNQDMVGLEGWTIHLKKEGQSDSSGITVVTDHTGYFEFENIPYGNYVIWEEMQEGWEAITDERLEIDVESTVCEHVLFKNKLSCENECELGTYCSEDILWECGNFDEDVCLEQKQIENCAFTETSEEYYMCEETYSKKYRDITKGFCNSEELACDAHTRTEWISEENCVFEQCETEESCNGNTVNSITECNIGYCNVNSGLCATETQREETNTDCGQDSVNEYCDGENIVREEETRDCVEENNHATCVAGSSVTILEECGPDLCTEFTDMDLYVKEYVYDEESCQVSEYLYCANDGEVYDICVGDILLQPYCVGNDHDLEQFDCSTLSGCYEFEVEECVYCEDEQGLCNGHKCTKKGQMYRQYTCGNGACSYTDLELTDLDGDYKDDLYCDSCIDMDRDGACDDADNCPYISNPTQVDSDNDGYGNACDEDRDGDGYPGSVDCNDWNKEIHPGAQEIKNNDRDDDCSVDTTDKGNYAPRQALYVDMAYDEAEIRPGEEFLVSVSVTNTYSKALKNVKIQLFIPGYGEKQVGFEENLKKGETVTKIFKLNMPKDMEGYEYLKATVSTDSLKRGVYRELKLPQN